MILDLTSFMQHTSIYFVLKALFLLVIALYAIFSLMLANKIRSFSKILFLPPQGGGSLMQKLTLIYSGIVILFFFLVLIML